MEHNNSHRWPFWWRVCILLNISFYNLLGNAFAAGVTPLFGLLIADLHCTVGEAGHLASYALLALGLSNILALPGSALMSKRYLILVSQLLFLACNIWAAKASSYGSLLATRIVGGLAGGVVEALGPTFVVETFAEKQLSRAIVVYMAFLALGSGFGPLFSGLIADHLKSWRWFFWILSIVTGVNFIGCLIMLPETSDKFTLEYEPNAQADVQQVSLAEKSQQDGKATTVEGAHLAGEYSTDRPRWYVVWKENSFYIPVPTQNPGRFFQVAWKSIVLMVMPPVTLAVLLYGMSIGWGVAISILTALVFQQPPYLWSSEAIGLFSISTIIGILIGVPVGGNLSDLLSHRSARKNDGVHHAESRLPALIIPSVVSPLGILIIGIYLDRNEIWIRQGVGSAMAAFGTTAAGTTILSYAVDAFPHRSGEIGVLLNIVKNVLGFALSHGAVDWWQAEGFLSQFGTMAGLLWAVYLLIIPLYIYGPRVRIWAVEKIKI